MMQFLIIGQIKTGDLHDISVEERARLIFEERTFALDKYLEGKVRQLWGRDDVQGGVLVIEAIDLKDAQSVVDNLPLARAGLLEIKVIPLTPYVGFTVQNVVR